MRHFAPAIAAFALLTLLSMWLVASPAAAQSGPCTFAGQWPTTSVTSGPAVLGVVARCTQPIDRASIAMSIDGASVPVDVFPQGDEWVIVSHEPAPEGDHTARVDLVASGQPSSETWDFGFTRPVVEQPGPDSPPSVGVVEREDGRVDTYPFPHTMSTCGSGLNSYFCSEFRDAEFTLLHFEDGDYFVGVIPADFTTHQTDPTCATMLQPSPDGPAAPTNLEVTLTPVPGGTGADLEWQDRATDESCYVVERVTWGQYPQQIQVIATLPADSTSYHDPRPYGAPGLAAGGGASGGIAYRVYAATSDARSEYSATVGRKLTQPAVATNAVCYEGDNTEGGPGAPVPLPYVLFPPVSRAGWSAELHWQSRADNETCFVVEESRNNAPFEAIALLPANSTAYHVPHFPISPQPQHASYRVTTVTETARSNPALFEVDIPPFPGMDASQTPSVTSTATHGPPSTGGLESGAADAVEMAVLGLAAVVLVGAIARRLQ
jgi:hypothetical protein